LSSFETGGIAAGCDLELRSQFPSARGSCGLARAPGSWLLCTSARANPPFRAIGANRNIKAQAFLFTSGNGCNGDPQSRCCRFRPAGIGPPFAAAMVTLPEPVLKTCGLPSPIVGTPVSGISRKYQTDDEVSHRAVPMDCRKAAKTLRSIRDLIR
jgi:hypothetical protein